MTKCFFWYVSSSTIFAVVTNHFRTSYISNIGKCSLVYLDQHKICAGNSDDGEIWKRCGQKWSVLLPCDVNELDVRKWRKVQPLPCFLSSGPLERFFFSSIVMLELMYTHFQQTNAKDSRLMASNLFLNVFFKIILTHGYTWLHMCKPSFVFFTRVVLCFFSFTRV